MTENRDHQGRYEVVAIGASAGGLRALSAVLSELPPDFPVPVLIVQHLDPHSESRMADILARRTKLKIVQAQEGDEIAAGVAYIAPPARHMLLDHGRIHLTTTELVHFVRPSVDLLFESVAAGFRGKTIGVILTGSGMDGALGLRAIKEVGGLTIVQDPATSESTGMPTAAVAIGAADIVVPLEQIAREIMEAVTQESANV